MLKSVCYLKEKLMGSIVVMLFLWYPTLASSLIQNFQCIDLDSGEYYLSKDPNIEC